jgi:phospholipase C
MGYVDGNTVTALWNYAQQFALSDNFFGSTFGPSTVGALHLAAADIAGAICGPADGVYGTIPTCGPEHGPSLASNSTPAPTNGQVATLYTDQDPLWDVCSKQDASALVAMSGPNLGDLLNAAGVSWGWFQGGFAVDRDGRCSSAHPPVALDRAQGIDPATDPDVFADYQAHHEPFQYYDSTTNPRHLPPSSVGMIGRTDQANHQYDLSDFFQALDAGNLPAVSFLKAAAYQDGHAGHSDPLDEQEFIVGVLNRLQRSPEWASTAVIIAWDDSNGYYDHVMPPLVNHSATLLDDGCGDSNDGPPARCGYGPRLPLLVISPFAKRNYVSHALLDQTSIVRFIDDNWLGGQRLTSVSFDNFAGSLADLFDFTAPPPPPLFLDPQSGEPAGARMPSES